MTSTAAPWPGSWANISRVSPASSLRTKPGAGGMKLLNFAYNRAPKDGSVIFTLHIGLPLHQALGGRGVRYDASKLIGIGRVTAGNAVTAVWHTKGVKTFADLSKKRVTLGSTGASSVSSIFPTVAQNLLGANFKVIMGYKGGEQVMLAMERGEVDGFGAFNIASMQATRPQYLSKKLVYPMVQWGLRREKLWSDIPLAADLAKSPIDKKAVEALSAQAEIGRSYYLAPGVPRDRVQALRAALKKTVTDSRFLSAAKETQDADPLRDGRANRKNHHQHSGDAEGCCRSPEVGHGQARRWQLQGVHGPQVLQKEEEKRRANRKAPRAILKAPLVGAFPFRGRR